VLAQMHRRRAGVGVLAGERRLVPAHRLHAGDDADVFALGLEDRPRPEVQFEERRYRMLAAGLKPAVPDGVEPPAKPPAAPVGCVSRWLPIAIGGTSAEPARRANIAPMSSTVTRQPSCSARALNQSRT